MERVIDVDNALAYLKNEMEVGFSVAITRNESLWEAKRSINDKLYFLNLIGVITKEELNEKEKELDLFYKKKKKELRSINDFCDLDVGF